MGGPNNTAGGTAGAATNAFANTFGRFLLAKINNDEAAKRQQADDKRQIFMIGLTKMMEQNPGAFADPAKLEQVFKEAGLSKSDPQALKGLANMFGTMQQGIDQQRLIAAQKEQEFNQLLTGGPTQATPQTAAPTEPPPMLTPQQPALAAVQIPQFTPGAQSPHKPLTGPAFDEVVDTPTVAPPVPTLPDLAPIDPQTISHMRQLSRLAPGRNLTVRSPDGKRTITLDRDEGLQQLAHSMIANGTRPFDVFRTFQREVGGAGLPDDVRAAAGIDGLTMLLEPELKKVAQDPNAKVNLAGALQTLQQQGLFVTPKEQETVLQPITQRVLAGNRRRLETQRQAMLQMAEQLRAEGNEELAEQLTQSIIVNQESQALRQTADQMDGLGLTPAQQTALNDTPTADEMLVDVATSTTGNTAGDRLKSVLQMEREKIKIKAEETAATKRAGMEAEQAVNLERVTGPINEVFGLSTKLLSMNTVQIAQNPTMLKEYSDLKDSLKTLIAKGVFGQVGNLTPEEANDAIASLPTVVDLLTSSDLSQRKLDRFVRIFKGIGGPDLFGGAQPSADPRATTTPTQDSYLDQLGVK